MKTITESLASIAVDWPLLLDDVYSITSGTGSGPGAGDERLPGGTMRLSIITETRHTLWHWCRIVLQERAASVLLDLRVDAEDVVAMCAWLRPHADWMDERYAISAARAEQDESAAVELNDLAGTIRSLVAPSGVKRPPVAPCPLGDCTGTIRGYIDSEHPESADLACDANAEHRWERDHWVDLGQQVADPTPQWLTSVELAAWMTERFRRRITEGQIRTWAWRHPIELPRRHGERYDRVQVASWYMARRGERVGA